MAIPLPGPPAVQGMFQLYGEGVPLGQIAKVTIPIGKPMATERQGAGNPHKSKWPSGLVEYDDFECTMMQELTGGALAWLLTWMGQCANSQTGQTGVAPDAAKRTLTVMQFSPDGVTEVAEWKLLGCFPIDAGKIELEAGSAKGVDLDLKFSVDSVQKL